MEGNLGEVEGIKQVEGKWSRKIKMKGKYWRSGGNRLRGEEIGN